MEQNNQNVITVLALLRAGLWGDDFELSKDTDWVAVRQELRYHAVQNLPVNLLVKYDEGNKSKYLQGTASACMRWYKLMKVQQFVTRLLEKGGIPHATIKGAAADIFYPEPMYRNMGDIDILVKYSEHQKTVDLLLENGCALFDNRNPRHTELVKDGIHIEVHRHFSVLNDAKRAKTLDNLLFSAVDNAEKKSIEGYEFYMLPQKENGLVLIEHINSHMGSGIGLRQIIDWMLYVDNALDDQAWFEGFSAIAREVGLEKLAIHVTRMCQIYLGLREDITWCQVADENLCHQLLIYIMNQGNFGCKQDKRIRGTIGVLSALDGNLNFFQLLQRNGCYNWKLLKKYPVLKPFAWIYQLVRYIRKGLKGKNHIKSFWDITHKKREMNDLMTELGVQLKNSGLQHEE